MSENNNNQLKIVWFNAAFSNIKTSIDASIQIRPITHHLKTFHNINQCLNYTQEINVEYVFLIITLHSLNVDLVQRANSVPSISFIYIHLLNGIDADQFKSLSKVRHVSINVEDIFQQLRTDIHHSIESLLLSYNLFETGKSTKNLSKESGKFLWQQFYVQVLFQAFDLDQAKDDMITYCRNFYIDDDIELEKISNFEQNYQAEHAVRWYTRDSFLYRLLNKTLRSENLDDMYKFRFILSELHTQISGLHRDYLRTISDLNHVSHTLTVYRGQLIAPKELDRIKENIESFISMNTFVSTSLNRNISFVYAGDGQRRPNLESVLFIISIDTNTCKTTFANIENYSWYNSEEEILITAGAIFRITEIEKEDNIWIIKLQACNPEHIQNLQEHHYPKSIEQFDNKKTFYFGLYAFFIAMGQIENSTKYLYDLFQTVNDKSKLFEFDIKKMNTFQQQDVIKVREEIIESTTDPEIRAVNLLEIAELLLEDGNIIEAIEYIERSQELIFQNNNNNNHVQPLKLARLYKTIGLLWNIQGKYEQALNLFKIILMIYNQHLPAIALQFGSIQSDIAMTYFYMGSYTDAIKHFNNSLDIYVQCLPYDHFIIGDCYLHLGMAYFRSQNETEAKRYFDNALEFYEKKQAQDNPCRIGKIYQCQGHLYASANYNDEAMRAYEKAEQMYKSILSSDHCFFAGLYSDMGLVLNNLNNLDLSLDYLNRALNILLNLQSNHEICLLGTVYYRLGENYFLQGLYFASLTHLEKASEIFKQFLPRHNETLHDILHYMAKAYDKLNMYTKAIDYYQQLFNIDVLFELETLITICFSLGRLFLKVDQTKEAIKHLQKSLELNVNYSNDKKLVTFPNYLLHTYRYLGLSFANLQDYSNAFNYFKEALDLCNNAEDLSKICKSLETFCHIGENLKLDFSSFDSASNMWTNSISMCQSALGRSYLNIGLAHFRLYQYETALSFLHNSLKIFEYLGDCNSTSTVVEHIGLSYYQIGDYNQAELFTLRRLTLLHLLYENNETSADFPYVYSRLARIKCEQRCYKEAEELCTRAFNLRAQHLLDNDIRLGVSFQTFGIIYNAQGKYNEAMEYFEKFQKILNTTRKSEHPYWAYLCENFGAVYYNTGQLGKSLEFYEQSLALAIRKYPFYRRFHDRLRYAIERIYDHFF